MEEKELTADDVSRKMGGKINLAYVTIIGAIILAIAFVLLSKTALQNRLSVKPDHKYIDDAYMMGDPFNGKIVYMGYFPEEVSSTAFNCLYISDCQLNTTKELDKFKINVDPYYKFGHVGETNILLSSFTSPVQYSLAYDVVTGKKITLKELTVTDKKDGNYYNVTGREINNSAGMSRDTRGSIEYTLDGPRLQQAGATDFNGYILQHSYWVWDCYNNKYITDGASGAHLAMVEMKHDVYDKKATCFFALIDSAGGKLLWTGYPNNLIKSETGFDADYYMFNCRREGDDAIRVLTRDKVLKVQISTGKILETIQW